MKEAVLKERYLSKMRMYLDHPCVDENGVVVGGWIEMRLFVATVFGV